MREILTSLNPRGWNWRKQRERAIGRDKYTCKHCGFAPLDRKGLHVHHIKPFRCFNTATGANRLKNLITLCAACHKKADAINAAKKLKSAPQYKPPHTPRAKIWAKQRRLALKRDNSTCQNCGMQPDKGLHVHHIIPRALLHLNDFVTEEQADDLRNLKTLCAKCHCIIEAETKLAYTPHRHWVSPLLDLSGTPEGHAFTKALDADQTLSAEARYNAFDAKRKQIQMQLDTLVFEKYQGSFCAIDFHDDFWKNERERRKRARKPMVFAVAWLNDFQRKAK